jgi:hypothetical protein
MIVDILLACKKKLTTQKIKMLSNRPYEKPEVELGCPRMKSYKGKVKTHKYINRQNQSTTGKL